jgi:hypothetical protein
VQLEVDVRQDQRVLVAPTRAASFTIGYDLASRITSPTAMLPGASGEP